MSFYVYLPCTNNQNTTADFTVKLPQPINLTSTWKCALCEVHRTRTIGNELTGEYYIVYKVTRKFQELIEAAHGSIKWLPNLRIRLSYEHLQYPKLLVQYVNDKVYDYIHNIYNYEFSLFKSFHDFVTLGGRIDITKYEYKNVGMMHMVLPPLFEVALSKCLIEYLNKPLQLNGLVHEKTQYYERFTNPHTTKPIQITFNGVELNTNIYTFPPVAIEIDIVTPVIIGETYDRKIGTVPSAELQKQQHMQSYVVKHRQYYSVSSKHIDSIRVHLYSNDQILSWDNSQKFLILLHFRNF